MHRTLVAVLLVTCAHAGAPDSGQTAVLASVRRFVDGFNKGDTKTIRAACADQTSIIDEFPPHEWHGAGACLQWVSDYDANARQNGISDGIVTLGNPSHVDITAGYAYVVVPANYVYKQRGRPVSEIGSIITLTLHKSQTGWRITGWSWAKH